MRILFVCTGNSCRSPMAELYFNDLCHRNGLETLHAGSAGLAAWDGGAISRPAAAVMGEMGIDCGAFRSARFTPALAAECDLLVAMTAGHAAAMRQVAPACADRVRLLLDFAGGGEVPDPFGGSVSDYRRVFEVMRPAVENLVRRLSGVSGCAKSEK